MRAVPALLVPVLLAACAVPVQEFRGPNGNTAYSMKCGSEVARCYQKAGEICPTGYTIIDRATGTVGGPLASGAMIATPQHNLAIECK